jgi:hypothetical protein
MYRVYYKLPIYFYYFRAMLIGIQYEDYPHKVKQENNVRYIFDFIRKKWLVLTPEEWVRQNFVYYIIQTLGFSRSSIALEKGINLGEITKRFDIVVYDEDTQPLILVECKRQNVPLSGQVAEQAINYLRAVNARFLIITNGDTAMAWHLAPLTILTELPSKIKLED